VSPLTAKDRASLREITDFRAVLLCCLVEPRRREVGAEQRETDRIKGLRTGLFKRRSDRDSSVRRQSDSYFGKGFGFSTPEDARLKMWPDAKGSVVWFSAGPLRGNRVP